MRTLILCLALILSAVVSRSLPAVADDGRLRIVLTALNPVVQGNADIRVRVTIDNPNSTAVTVPVWQLPSDDIPTPIIQVTDAAGRRAPYTGPLVKWSSEALQTGVTFAPGASRVYVIELSALYEIGNGDYLIDYSQDGPGKYDPKGRSTRIFGPVLPAFFKTSGRIRQSGSLVLAPQAATASLSTTRCSTTEYSSIYSAVQGATSYSANATHYFSGKTSAAKATSRYTTWFGTPTTNRWSTVGDNFVKIHGAFTTAAINIDCSCKKKTVYAYVYPARPYQIYVCGAFWVAPTTGTDSKAGTLIHEMSHFTVVANTDDYVYGQIGAKNLAIADPDKAIANADNHEYFAENNPPLR